MAGATSAARREAEGWNEITSTIDPAAHAEVAIIRRACGRLLIHAPSTYKFPTSNVPADFCVALFDGVNSENTIYRFTAVGEPPLMHAGDFGVCRHCGRHSQPCAVAPRYGWASWRHRNRSCMR
jgi:hypothetical protein